MTAALDEGLAEIINALNRLDKTFWPAQTGWSDDTATAIDNLHHHLPALTNALYLLESLKCDSGQLERMVHAINAAMPHFKSAMGAPCDHAELALGQLIVERDTLREALKAITEIAASGAVMRHETGKPTWTATGEITKIARMALASLYDEEARKESA